MNTITTWISENKNAAMLMAAFLLCTGGAGWFAFDAWNGYLTVSQSYSEALSKLTKLSQQNPFPNQANLVKFQANLDREHSELDNLAKSLQAFRIPPFHDLEKARPQDRPQLLQDGLRTQVTAIKAAAASKGVTLPPGFYLGLEEYENRLPSPDDVMILARQLTVLDWIAGKLTSREGLILSEFTRSASPPVSKTAEAGKKPITPADASSKSVYDTVGDIRISFRCDQPSLRDLMNSIASAPYFLVIENLQLQNSVAEPPRRDTSSEAPQSPTDGQSTAQRLPIIVGREQVNVSMKIRFLEFNREQFSPETPVKPK
ncbi:MAG: hypothetical protein RLZZ408_301 [Verrucomicrobiota bacterium]|jgi:hypothetical protein